MHRLLLALVACVVCFAVEASQSVGLVLSGGGAKGIAHIGVIQALEDNDIPIDYVAGTSMGSIVGGLYAMGYTPAEMLALIRSKEFQDWSTGTVDPHLTYYYARKPDTPKVVSFDINLADSTAFPLLFLFSRSSSPAGPRISRPSVSMAIIVPSSFISPSSGLRFSA